MHSHNWLLYSNKKEQMWQVMTWMNLTHDAELTALANIQRISFWRGLKLYWWGAWLETAIYHIDLNRKPQKSEPEMIKNLSTRIGLRSSPAQQHHGTDRESEVGREFKVAGALASQVCNCAPYQLLRPKHYEPVFLLSLVQMRYVRNTHLAHSFFSGKVSTSPVCSFHTPTR